MSRPIEYRAWVKDLKEYRKVAAIYYVIVNGIKISHVELFGKNFTDKNILRSINEVVLEQYTGLKDKNSVKIHEGDIIKAVNVHDGDEECWEQPYGPAIPQEVKWDEERLRWSFGGCRRILDAPEDFEVIGNIHDAQQGGEE